MSVEMVDEVDDDHQKAQDMAKESVKEMHVSKKCIEAAKHVAAGRLVKWKLER